MKKNRKNSGFSLVELLTVVGILAIVSGIIAGVLYATLRGTSKIKITTAVSQGGSYTLSLISGIVRASDAITGVGELTSTSTPPFKDCTATLKRQSIILKQEAGEVTLACDDVNKTITKTTTSGTVSLIDSSEVMVDTTSVNTCYFQCSQLNPYDNPVVEFSFTILDKNAPGAAFETKSSGIFKTSVSLRNFKP